MDWTLIEIIHYSIGLQCIIMHGAERAVFAFLVFSALYSNGPKMPPALHCVFRRACSSLFKGPCSFPDSRAPVN